MSVVDLKGLVADAGDELERWGRTINPQFVRVLKTIGFDPVSYTHLRAHET